MVSQTQSERDMRFLRGGLSGGGTKRQGLGVYQGGGDLGGYCQNLITSLGSFMRWSQSRCSSRPSSLLRSLMFCSRDSWPSSYLLSSRRLLMVENLLIVMLLPTLYIIDNQGHQNCSYLQLATAKVHLFGTSTSDCTYSEPKVSRAFRCSESSDLMATSYS